jgi:hypothetical protein
LLGCLCKEEALYFRHLPEVLGMLDDPAAGAPDERQEASVSVGWTQVAGNRWRKATQTPHGGLMAEITQTLLGSSHTVAVRGAAQQGLILSDIGSLAEAQEVGDASLAQFSAEPLPGVEFTTEPLRPAE